MLIIAQIQKIKDDLTRLLGKVKITDGTNDMPSMDDPARAGWAQIKDNVPTATGKNNAEIDLSYDGDDNLTQIDMTIGAVVYRKTLTWTDGNLTNISVWSVV
jgi:hypothetical protein